MTVERRSRRFSSATLERVARRLMNASPLCALATVSPGGRAHINHMYFAWSDRFEVIWISYAVFCLKKKSTARERLYPPDRLRFFTGAEPRFRDDDRSPPTLQLDLCASRA